ncbi:cytochrome c biogenesis protein [Calderihabitans maritimus]|uniref:Heme exporter protein C n=1 Tax=Calderihabitans maritimus TaxID=1246530 RepID=A0A1Z5HW28_9FIRM|nr:cytochrome c biogenesis protein [Calderihabitans maritimus]GAW93742.1 cytochrome c biogenesis ABC transporter permease [Calderihabitans maritimus]
MEYRGLDTGRYHRVLGWVTFVMLLAALYFVFLYAPLEKVMREVQKIFYFHVASAWNAFFAFFIVFVSSIIYLKTRDRRWDTVAAISAEIGVLFTTLVLITGPIWARKAWGIWWNWEPRLTTTLILWFLYLAYLLIRSSGMEGEKKHLLAAVFGIIAFIDVPIVFFAIRWWGAINHPEVVKGSGGGLHPKMLHALIVSVLAFTFLYFYLLQKGLAIERCRQRIQEIKKVLREKFD